MDYRHLTSISVLVGIPKSERATGRRLTDCAGAGSAGLAGSNPGPWHKRLSRSAAGDLWNPSDILRQYAGGQSYDLGTKGRAVVSGQVRAPIVYASGVVKVGNAAVTVEYIIAPLVRALHGHGARHILQSIP